jgi:hypothetical protein
MITLVDYYMGRDKLYPDELTAKRRLNATRTVELVNALLKRYQDTGGDVSHAVVSSGWRPPQINAKVRNAAPRSNHMECLACDIADVSGKLDAWCLANQSVLHELGLWLEHPGYTKGWCHVQTVPPRSGNRVFIP